MPARVREQGGAQEELVVARVLDGRDGVPLEHPLVRAEHAQQVDAVGRPARLLAPQRARLLRRQLRRHPGRRHLEHLLEHAQLGRRRRAQVLVQPLRRHGGRKARGAAVALRRRRRGRRRIRSLPQSALEFAELDASTAVWIEPREEVVELLVPHFDPQLVEQAEKLNLAHHAVQVLVSDSKQVHDSRVVVLQHGSKAMRKLGRGRASQDFPLGCGDHQWHRDRDDLARAAAARRPPRRSPGKDAG